MADAGGLLRTIRDASDVDLGDRASVGFADLDRSVEEDVTQIRAIAGLPDGVAVAGLVYDVQTGLMREVAPAA